MQLGALLEPFGVLRALARRCSALCGDLEAIALVLDGSGKRAVCGGPERLSRVADAVLDRIDDVGSPQVVSGGVLGEAGSALWIPIGDELIVAGLVVVGEAARLPDPRAPDLQRAIEESQPELRAAHELRLAWFRGDRMTWFALRRFAEDWIGIGRRRGEATWLGLLGVDGLAEINRKHGLARGDEAFAAATNAVAESLSPGYFARLPGAKAAALFTGTAESAELEQRVAAAERAVRDRYDVHLRVGFASTTDAGDAELLVARASAALEQAQAGEGGVVRWNPAVDDAVPGALPDLREIDGFTYHQITAVWQLFDALTDSSDLDKLLRTTLATVAPVLAAEHASLWTRAEGDTWERRIGDEEQGRAAAALVVEAARRRRAVLAEKGGPALAVPLPLEPNATSALHFSGTQLRCEEEHIGFVSRLADQIGKVLRHRETLEWAAERRRTIKDRLREQTRELRRMVRTQVGLVGSSPALREVLRRAERAAATSLPVLLTGETGTGKEVAARMIHRQSRREGPFVVVDCGAIPAALLESELFGHEKGAFTGADSRKLGRFEQARGGTLFLDEIGELPIELQPKLLRVLQESVIRRIGGTEEIRIDFRLIAATHRNLERMVGAGTFREDLLFRLRVIELHLPPVRERGDDVILLAYHFLRQFCLEMGRDFLPLSRDAEQWLLVHSWPGNVRELQNILRRAVAMVPGSEITPDDLHLGLSVPDVRATVDDERVGTAGAPIAHPIVDKVGDVEPRSLAALAAEWVWNVWSTSDDPPPPLKAVQSLVLRSLFFESGGNFARTGELLGTSPATVASRLEKLGHPDLSRSLQSDPFGKELERRVKDLNAPGSAREMLDEVEAAILQELFVRCRGNKSKMARLLGVSRQTLLRRLEN